MELEKYGRRRETDRRKVCVGSRHTVLKVIVVIIIKEHSPRFERRISCKEVTTI